MFVPQLLLHCPDQTRRFCRDYVCFNGGTGAGFAESWNIQQLPIILRQTGEKLPALIVDDSKEGWCDALTLGLKTWYAGKDIDFDFSQL